MKLPLHLQDHPYLQEFYGTVEWSSKAVFSQYMGWFSGSVAELHPLSPKVIYINRLVNGLSVLWLRKFYF